MINSKKRETYPPPAYIFLLIFLICITSTCSSYNSLTPEQLNAKIKTGNPLVVDIRIPEKYKDGHIPGAVNIELHTKTFIENMNNLPKVKELALYCDRGLKTEKAASMISDLGFSKIYVLSKGFESWKKAGLDIEK